MTRKIDKNFLTQKQIRKMTELEILRDIAALPGYFTKPVSKGSAEVAERNYKMVCDRAKGMSYKEMSKKYNLSASHCASRIQREIQRYICAFQKGRELIHGKVIVFN